MPFFSCCPSCSWTKSLWQEGNSVPEVLINSQVVTLRLWGDIGRCEDACCGAAAMWTPSGLWSTGVNASTPAGPTISTLASMEIPMQLSVKKCHQAPEMELLPLPLLVSASSSSVKQHLQTHVSGVQEKGVKAVKPKTVAELIRTRSRRLLSPLLCSQAGWLFQCCLWGTIFSSDTSHWDSVSTTLPIFAVGMFAFFPLMFNTNTPYVNLSLFPSAFPTVDTKNGISSLSSKIFRLLKIFWN